MAMTTHDQEAMDRLINRIAENAGAIEQAVEAVEHMAETGVLAGINAVLETSEENFSAVNRPEFMGMVSNAMMLLGLLSQIRYDMLFNMAMSVPEAVNEGYERFQQRTEPLKVREIVRLMRSPEFGGALEMMTSVLTAVKGSPGRG